MKIQTKHFGEIVICDETIITFPQGLPGFEEFHNFAIIKNTDPENSFHWLQCIEDADVSFVVTNPFEVVQNYDFEIPDNLLDMLKIQNPEDVLVLSIVVIPEKIEKLSINLKAPVIINVYSRLGKQLVLDDPKYSTKYYIYDGIENK